MLKPTAGAPALGTLLPAWHLLQAREPPNLHSTTASHADFHPLAGGDVTAWAFTLANSAKSVAFISKQPFTPTDGDGTTTDPYSAELNIAYIPDGVYVVSVTATTATGSATSNWSPPVMLGTPPALTIVSVVSHPQDVTIKVTTPQTVAIAARAARSTISVAIRSGSTAASQPTVFTVTLK